MAANRVQFNLLPDIKQASVKLQRTQKLAASIAVIVSAVSIAIFLIMLVSVDVIQKKQLGDADKQITDYTNQLNNSENINKILTIQNQLNTLVGLNDKKHISSRLFTYLPEITPTNVNLNSLALDLDGSTLQVDGTADSQKTVNTYIDTLKFTTYTINSDDSPKAAFPSVVESSFGLGEGSATFSLNVSFDPILFANSNKDANGKAVVPKLSVPKLTTTRSVIDDPSSAIFGGQNNGGAR